GQMNSVNTDRSSNVLDRLLTHIVEFETEFILNLVTYDARNHDAARIGQGFQSCRYIDPVPEDVIPIDNDIADINAHTELDAFLWRQWGSTLDHGALDIDSTPNGIHDADKFNEHAIACRLHYAATMLGDFRVDQLFAVSFKLTKCAFLV